MAVSRGFYEKLLMIQEVTYGVTPSVTPGDSVSLPFNTNGLSSDENMIESPTIRYGNRFPTSPSFGNINVGGDVVVPLDAINIGWWFKLGFGAPVTTGAGPYLHTFTPKNSNPSWSLQGGFGDNSVFFLWDGIKMSKTTFNFAVNSPLQVTMSLLGQGETKQGTILDATPQEETIEIFQAKQILLKVNGTTVADAMSVSLDIDQGLAADLYTLSSNGYRIEAPEGKLKITGSSEMLFRDATYYDLAFANTEVSLEIIATNGTNDITITLPEVVFPRKPVNRSGYGPVSYPLEFEAYFQDDASGYPITIELTNDKASYV